MIVSSALDVYNLALSAVHARGRLTALTDNKRERFECDRWYEMVFKVTQEASFWPSNKTITKLTDKKTRNFQNDWQEGDPDPQFKYSYELPYNYLRARYLTNYDRFTLTFDQFTQSIRLNTNTDDAVLVYTMSQDDLTVWEPDLVQATVYGLAGHIAGPITGRGELIQKNINLANEFLQKAQTAVDDDHIPVEHIPPEFIARGYGGDTTSHRFIYPYGSFFSAAVTNP
ncbi:MULTISPECIES: hypothetical protein [unclassified Roseobacter]|uniref:hypothetical protein n=1 Tax=unclassified Roseobacter TaxID=196798 RepID=UPI0014924A2C|nr:MULTISPECIES: hypothetical protein [unclassified Roseobacter]NNY17309.1 hypothetical protein [Roseobacter sp. HKCCD8191]